jgi:hypothetical protein
VRLTAGHTTFCNELLTSRVKLVGALETVEPPEPYSVDPPEPCSVMVPPGAAEGGAEAPPIEQPGIYSHEAIGTMVHDGSVMHALELSSQ